jgi:hypothetical protein
MPEPLNPRIQQRTFPKAFPSPVVSFPRKLVLAGETSVIDVQPYTHFRGQFLAVTRKTGDCFKILDLRVGTISHHPGEHGISAEFFVIDCGIAELKETAFNQFSRWDISTASPSHVIRLTVKNMTVKEAEFVGCLLGIFAQ